MTSSSSSSSAVVRGGYTVTYDGGPFTTGFVLLELSMLVVFLLAHLSIRKRRRGARGRYERLDTTIGGVGARAEIGFEALGGLALGMAGYSQAIGGGVGGAATATNGAPSMSNSNLFASVNAAGGAASGGGGGASPSVGGGVGGGGGSNVSAMNSPTVAPLGGNGSFAGGVGGGGGFGASLRRASSSVGHAHLGLGGGVSSSAIFSSSYNNPTPNPTGTPPAATTTAITIPAGAPVAPLSAGGHAASPSPSLSRSPSVSPLPSSYH